jgi:hypothetical protein
MAALCEREDGGVLMDLFDEAGAAFSEDRRHRYELWRIWDRKVRKMVVIGLNPSTADETKNDPTIRRCIDFARRWGFARLNHAEPLRATARRIRR